MRKRAFLLVAGLLVIALVGGTVAWQLTRRAVRRAITRQEQIVDLTALVTQVRELNRLETASMRVVHVSTVTQSYEMVPNAIAGDELTFLAAGDVIAGIDMSRLGKDDIRRDADGTIIFRLPSPQILVSRIDNRESRVLNRKTGMLRRADMNLESRARQNAEQSIRNEAVAKGILPLAATNAEKKLADFLHTLGAKKVRFEGQGAAGKL